MSIKFVTCGLLVSLALFGVQAARAAEPARVRPITAEEAAQLSDRQIADLALAQLAERVVAVERPCTDGCAIGNPLPPGPPVFDHLRLLLRPALAAPGLCAADVISVRLDRASETAAWPDLKRLPAHPLADAIEAERTDPPMKASVASLQTHYIAVSSDEEAGRAACANALRINEYFTAPDFSVAKAAVHTLTGFRDTAVSGGPRQFALDCPADGAVCRQALASLDPSRLRSVEVEPCPDGGRESRSSCWSLQLLDPASGPDVYLYLSIRTIEAGQIDRVGLFWMRAPVV